MLTKVRNIAVRIKLPEHWHRHQLFVEMPQRILALIDYRARSLGCCRMLFLARAQIMLEKSAIDRQFTAVRSMSTADPSAVLLQHHVTTPPIKPWPQRLYPKRLASMISRQQNLDLALQIFLYAGNFHPDFSHNYETYLAIVQRLSRARAFEPVEALLSQLQSSQLKCGENLFIVVIRNYGLAGRPKCALRTFLRMEKYGIQRSVRSLNTLLNALVQTKQYELVHLMFKNSRSKFGVVTNVFTGNILIKALIQKNGVESAVKVLDEMPAMGIVPNVVTYTTISRGYAMRGDMNKAKKMFGEILDRGWVPDATAYTVVMDGYCRLGRLVDAVKVMDDMEENGVEPNDVTYGVMIEAFCKERKSGEAVNMLDDMLDKKFIPSSALCCKVIDLLCAEGKVEDACELWKRMLKNNCIPDNAILSTLIHWLCKRGKVLEARKLFDEFDRGSIPSMLTYNTLIAGMCESGGLSEVGKLWDDMVDRGCAPNEFTYSMLIRGFCKMGYAMEGIRMLEEMLEKGWLPGRVTYALLIEGLRKLGNEEGIWKLISIAMSSGKVEADSWGLFFSEVIGKLDDATCLLDRILLDKAI